MSCEASTVGWVEERNPTIRTILLILSLPRGVHLFCLPKINEPNKRAAHARPAGTLRFSIWSGMTETPYGQTAVMLIRPVLRCSASHKGVIRAFCRLVLSLRSPTLLNYFWWVVGLHFIQPNLQSLPNPPFVLTSSGFLSGLETYLFERSEFGESPWQKTQRSEAVGQHMGCPGVVRGMGTHSPDSTLSRNNLTKPPTDLNAHMQTLGFIAFNPTPNFLTKLHNYLFRKIPI